MAGRYQHGSELVVENLDKVQAALKAAAPDARRQLNRRFRTIGTAIATTASRRVNSRTGRTAGSYKVQRRGASVSIINDTPAGSIIEFAGKVNPQGSGRKRTKAGVVPTTQGATLIRTLNQEYGKPGRLMWAAYDDLQPWIRDEVNRALNDAEAALKAVCE